MQLSSIWKRIAPAVSDLCAIALNIKQNTGSAGPSACEQSCLGSDVTMFHIMPIAMATTSRNPFQTKHVGVAM
jgi:hypothetical protein